MSLLLVPLEDATGPGDLVQESLYEVISLHLVHPTAGGEVEAAGAQRLRVVPYNSRGWEHPSLDARTGGILLTSLPGWLDGPPEDEFPQRLERGLRDCLDSLLESATESPTVVLCPVLRLGDRDADPGVLKRLQEVWDLLDQAASVVSNGQRLPQSNFRVIPWVFASSLPTRQAASPLFLGPNLSGGAIRPLVFGLPGATGVPLNWATWGRNQLVGALLALHYVSRKRDLLDKVLPESGDVLAAHLGLLSCPLEASVERQELDRIRQILPPIDRVEEESRRCEAIVQRALQPHLKSLRDSVKRAELPRDAFCFGPSVAPKAEGEDARLTQVRDLRVRLQVEDFSFRVRPTREERRGLSRARRADQVHNCFVRTTGLLYEESMGELTDGVLKTALQDVSAQATSLEEAIQGLLEDGEQVGEDLAASAGRAVAACRLCQKELQGLTKPYQDRQGPAPQQPLDQAVRLRGTWLGKEEELHGAGANLPAPVSVALEGTAVLLVGAFASWLVLLASTSFSEGTRSGVALLVGLVAAVLVVLQRSRSEERHEAAWSAFSDEMKSQADRVGAQMAGVVEHRLGFMKLATCAPLRTALQLSEDRLLVEVGGVSATVDGLLTTHRFLGEAGRAEERGRLSVDLPAASRAEEDLPLEAFAARLRRLWKKALALDSLPGRVPTRQYREAIRQVVQAALRNSTSRLLPSEFRSAVTGKLQEVVRQAHDPALVPPGTASPVRLLLVSKNLEDCCDDGGPATMRLAGEEPEGFPSDRAIAMQVKPMSVPAGERGC